MLSSAGFAVIQWWASLGLVAYHWTAGEDQEAEAYYSTIEGMLGDRYVYMYVYMCISVWVHAWCNLILAVLLCPLPSIWPLRHSGFTSIPMETRPLPLPCCSSCVV